MFCSATKQQRFVYPSVSEALKIQTRRSSSNPSAACPDNLQSEAQTEARQAWNGHTPQTGSTAVLN